MAESPGVWRADTTVFWMIFGTDHERSHLYTKLVKLEARGTAPMGALQHPLHARRPGRTASCPPKWLAQSSTTTWAACQMNMKCVVQCGLQHVRSFIEREGAPAPRKHEMSEMDTIGPDGVVMRAGSLCGEAVLPFDATMPSHAMALYVI